MFGRLFLLFTVIPLLELALLIELGGIIGVANTIAVVIITGFIGAALARSQGFGILNQIQSEMANGQLPGNSLIEGLLVLAGGLLLLTPGILTDLFGFSLLIPVSRLFLKKYLVRYFRKKINQGEIQTSYTIEDERAD
jgi:UPF0716 protein FxsA